MNPTPKNKEAANWTLAASGETCEKKVMRLDAQQIHYSAGLLNRTSRAKSILANLSPESIDLVITNDLIGKPSCFGIIGFHADGFFKCSGCANRAECAEQSIDVVRAAEPDGAIVPTWHHDGLRDHVKRIGRYLPSDTRINDREPLTDYAVAKAERCVERAQAEIYRKPEASDTDIADLFAEFGLDEAQPEVSGTIKHDDAADAKADLVQPEPEPSGEATEVPPAFRKHEQWHVKKDLEGKYSPEDTERLNAAQMDDLRWIAPRLNPRYADPDCMALYWGGKFHEDRAADFAKRRTSHEQKINLLSLNEFQRLQMKVLCTAKDRRKHREAKSYAADVEAKLRRRAKRDSTITPHIGRFVLIAQAEFLSRGLPDNERLTIHSWLTGEPPILRQSFGRSLKRLQEHLKGATAKT